MPDPIRSGLGQRKARGWWGVLEEGCVCVRVESGRKESGEMELTSIKHLLDLQLWAEEAGDHSHPLWGQ